MSGKTLCLTSMDAGLLRQIATKVELLNLNDALLLRGIADSVDAVLHSAEQSEDAPIVCQSEDAPLPIGRGESIERQHAGCGGTFRIFNSHVSCERCGTPYSSATVNTLAVPTVQANCGTQTLSKLRSRIRELADKYDSRAMRGEPAAHEIANVLEVLESEFIG